MIEARRLSRMYGDRIAVRDLTFEVRKGEVMGLLGPNGAGKSTTMKMLTCYLPPSSGTALVCGYPLSDSIEVRRRIGYLPENAPSWSDLDVRSHLLFMGRMHAIPAATLEDRIGELSRVCSIESVLHRRIDELSKGFRQRVGLAASMLHDPECLILDEPTTGLDPNQIVEIRRLIRHLGEQKAVLLSSHVLSEVEAACDRMMIIDNGEMRAVGSAEELAAQARSGSVLHLRFKQEGESGIAVITALRQQLPELDVEGPDPAFTLCHPDPEMPLAELAFRSAVEAGAVIIEMRPDSTTLEDVFRRITGGEL